MKVQLVMLTDLRGTHWRLAIDESKDAPRHPLVVLEKMSDPGAVPQPDPAIPLPADPYPDHWLHVRHVTRNPAEVGVEWRSAGVMMINAPMARGSLVHLMFEYGATPAGGIEVGIGMLHTLPGVDAPVIEEPSAAGHTRMRLLEYLVSVEAVAGEATPGIWRTVSEDGAAQLQAALQAVITGAPSDPVAESMSSTDARHVVASQPQAVGALARKLREAFYLLQDVSRALTVARSELGMASPTPADGAHPANLALFDRWISALGARLASFPTISVPDPGQPGAPTAGQAPRPTALFREELLKIARHEALREGAAGGAPKYLPRDHDEAGEFIPHDWVIWAMAAAVRASMNGGLK